MNENGRERQTLAAPKGYVRPTHTYGLQRVGLAALINIRFLKYLPHPLAHRRPRPCLSAPPPASSRHRTPPPLAERSSKARYSICIFKLESLYTHTRDTATCARRVYTCKGTYTATRESVLPPPSPFAITITTAAGVVLRYSRLLSPLSSSSSSSPSSSSSASSYSSPRFVLLSPSVAFLLFVLCSRESSRCLLLSFVCAPLTHA